METHRDSSLFWIRLFIGMICVACLCLAISVMLLRTHVDANAARLLTTRVISVGRTDKDIVRWMGEPDSTLNSVMIGGQPAPKVMIYRSVHSRSVRLNNRDDIWIVVDKKGRVAAIYYPDFAQDRAIVKSEPVPTAGN